MEVIYARCCGLDVHQKTVVACLITPKGKEILTFKTMTSDLLKLADWIVAKGGYSRGYGEHRSLLESCL